VISILKKATKNIVVEGNATSQLAALIRRETGQKVDASILKYDGRPFSPLEIVDRLRKEVKTW
jgi:2-oxoglutarate ferredoxin oxidoreductase subunit alpha